MMTLKEMPFGVKAISKEYRVFQRKDKKVIKVFLNLHDAMSYISSTLEKSNRQSASK